MSQELLRLIISGLATLLLAREATRAGQGTRRRQAFRFGAAGFGLLALGNLLVLIGIVNPALLTLLVGIGLALLIGSLVSLFLAYRSGELSDQFRRAGAMVADERKKLQEREAARATASERDDASSAKE
jgi:hypothetical protein